MYKWISKRHNYHNIITVMLVAQAFATSHGGYLNITAYRQFVCFFSPILTFQHEPWRIHVCCISITWEPLMQRMGIFANICIDTNSVQLYREILADLSLLSIWTLIPCLGTIAPRQSSSMSFVDPAQGVKENCFRTRTMATLVSNMAKRDPIQLLGPAPNGRKEKDLICCLFSFLNLKMEKMYILVMIDIWPSS